ncbi:MAG: hypothetical protein KAH17_08155 [Bacteroidales bacterium]|nr:hypothetical protein [Bacteroidales bacterium]
MNSNLEGTWEALTVYLETSDEVSKILEYAKELGFQVKETDTFLSKFYTVCSELNVCNKDELRSRLSDFEDFKLLLSTLVQVVGETTEVENWLVSPSFLISLSLLNAERDPVLVGRTIDQVVWDYYAPSIVLEALKRMQ